MRYVSLLLLLVLGISIVPNATAQRAPGVIDFDPEEPLAPILEESEVDKIAQLQATARINIVSPVSPDEQTVLTLIDNYPTFLDIENGATVPINAAFFNFSLLDGRAGTYHWSDADTLETLATIPPEEPGGSRQLQRVLIDRNSGAVSTEPLEATLPGSYIDVAPDLTQALVLIASHTERAPETQSIQLSSYQSTQSHDPDNPSTPQELEVTTESSNLALLNIATGDVATLAELPAGTTVENAIWNTVDNRIAVTYSGLLDRSITSVELDGALLSSMVYRDAVGALSPEENPFFQNNELLVFDLENDTIKTLRSVDGDGTIFSPRGSWSTDGTTLMMEVYQPMVLEGRDNPIYLWSEGIAYRFYNTNLDEQGRVSVDEWASDFEMTSGTFISPTMALFAAGIGMNTWLYTYDLTTDVLQVIHEEPGAFSSPRRIDARVINDGAEVVYTFSSFVSPTEIYRSNIDGTAVQQLTQINAEVAEISNTRMDTISFTLSNGQTREGWLIQSAEADFPPEDVPIVIWREGGPGATISNNWRTSVQQPFGLLPNFNIALLVVSLPGYEGYGAEFYNALADGDNFGRLDIDEMAEISRQVLDQGWAASGQLGMSGCSYGGYFSLQSIVRHPDLCAAINPQCALIDLIVEWTRGYASNLPRLMGPDTPYTNPQEYIDDSPSYNVDQMDTSVLTFHGTEDFLPITLNENLHQQLIDREVSARMVRFIDEGHVLLQSESQLYAAQEQLDWFRTYLVAQPDPGPGDGPDRFQVMLPLVGR